MNLNQRFEHIVSLFDELSALGIIDGIERGNSEGVPFVSVKVDGMTLKAAFSCREGAIGGPNKDDELSNKTVVRRLCQILDWAGEQEDKA